MCQYLVSIFSALSQFHVDGTSMMPTPKQRFFVGLVDGPVAAKVARVVFF